ncbi:MAG: YecA family protein, partial [Flavobacteriales bacterium]
MKKIGRNDPCPCGSGKKYKKCCLNTPVGPPKDMDMAALMEKMKAGFFNKESHDPTELFNRLDNNSLIGLFALLQALPQNHGKNIRLEELQRKALKLRSQESRSPLNVPELREYIHQHYPHNSLEDPPQNLFTENIMTPLGNRLVFAGITDGQLFTLQQFMAILGNPSFQLPNAFREEAMGTALLMTTISDQIVRRFGHDRNVVAKPEDDNQIFFPSEEFIADHIGAFTISESDVQALASSLTVLPNAIDQFILNVAEVDLDTSDHEDDPLLFHPILRDGGAYRILSPTSIVFACVNKIIGLAIRHGVLDVFMKHYSEVSWNYSTFMLDDMGFVRVQHEFPAHSLPIHEGLFQFDTDKFAYIVLQYDKGDAYDPGHPFAYHFDEALNEKVQDRRKEVFNQLRGNPRLAQVHLFNINLFLGIGRPTKHSFGPTTASWRVIGFNAPDLQCLYRSGKCHNLTLWNYTEAYASSKIDTPFFLTNIAYYLTHDESFYFDDAHYDHMTLEVGFELDFRAEATTRLDEHSASYLLSGRKVHLPISREALPAPLPIYSSRRSPGVPFLVTTETLDLRMWVRQAAQPKDSRELSEEEQFFSKEICIAIAYWLNEMHSEVNALTAGIEAEPIVVDVQLVNYEGASKVLFEEAATDVNLKPISYSVSSRHITLNLDEHFIHSIHRQDNRGEQNLMNAVLLGMMEILRPGESESRTLRREIHDVIEHRVPLGGKKKLLVRLGNEDIRISPAHIKGVRKLNRHEVNRQIDGLAKKLSPTPYRAKSKLPLEEKKVLLRRIVETLYNGLRTVLARYDQTDLLQKFQMFYESAIQQRERRKFEAVPLALCFGEHCDIERVLAEKRQANASYSVSLRCLIEHIVAEPSKGSLPLDVEAVDKALAYMLNIVNWGSLSDKLWLEIADIEVSLLASGRIGTDKRFETETMAPFHEAKLAEDLTDLKDTFDQAFVVRRKPGEAPRPNSAFEGAFLDEFQVPFVNFLDITAAASDLALTYDNSVYNGTVQGLVHEVAGKAKCPEELVEKVIKRFGLFDRGTIDNVREYGFKSHEFFPWRFGRELSLLRRPFLLGGVDKSTVTFGARSLHEFKLNLVHLMFEGRWDAASAKMKTFVRGRNAEVGKAFNKSVFQAIKEALPATKVYPEVGIGPGKALDHSVDLGDIDV